ncbi:hypothetical protein C6Y45_02730 [Alkalicoccus saliphilus]|uniref:Uncharacterized protein n=1 Tax=Alkalicoccus saliphilus TaxID=200989 RepID=A0A2T4UA89_9BACI|nr:hypothetical protein C6Y45_02730 [Alkalicoccus saliphilus]
MKSEDFFKDALESADDKPCGREERFRNNFSGKQNLIITLKKCFWCIDIRFPAFAFRDAFRAGRPQLISSFHWSGEMDLRLVLDRPGVVPAAAAGK